MEVLDKDLQSVQEVRNLIAKAKRAQDKFKNFSQEQIDKIIRNMVEAVEAEASRLAKMAYEETGFGKWEDKVLKNKFASRTVYNHIKDMKTVGILNEDKEKRILEVAVPVGVIAGLIPSTNPTSTTIYKSIISLKAGNAIVFSPHPSAKECIIETAKILSKAAVDAGAPDGIIGCITVLTMEGTNELMKHRDVSLILATGGEAMVKAAYSSGTPAIGVGPGNGPAFIEKSADVQLAVKRIIDSKTFDNGVICASEQSIVVEECNREKVVSELKRQGAYFLSKEESDKLGKFILRENGTMNPKIVGKSAQVLADLAGISIPYGTKVLISEQSTVGKNNPYSREKLAPILAFYCEENWEKACKRCIELLMNEGKGHTLVIHSNNEKIIKEFALKKPVSRILVNAPGALGGIGGATNLVPALTLGCGAVGGSATSDNISPMNLLNVRRVAYGVRELEDLRENEPKNQCEDNDSVSEKDIENIVKSLLLKLQR
ncbi:MULTISPECIES: acetaldehyde dehydrogenase (acetylating) [Clostridium]|uniref:Aldehyde-alcohol dehydrogenase n=2 Tax=Clostridium TaxID=1485 RepID=A0A151APE6_9CLOT|nr:MULTISPECIES: acetaldehyde dehydrogenase (acetylating) [Clostridium]KYH29499.1 aldehyde-alcohol dehydrogenase [Clostridium colicanis DSM 13634]PRR70742.1 Aldehyde-alcohol dehydrogenase [Clostridium thermopalmarium DSM 5974]PVZ22576.1 acetaldehyde dehydrogenase [Clostridium thermopalmarium DSM 5974]